IPRSIGAGYVDYDRGRMQPGPLWLLALLIIAMAACLVSDWHVGWAIENNQPSTLLPALAYVGIALTILVLVLSTFSLFLDRYRFPVVLLLAAWFPIPPFHNSGHYFPISDLRCSSSGGAQCSLLNDVHTVVEPIFSRPGAQTAKQPPVLIVICASG